MPISIEADPTLTQGYLKVNGVTAATVTSTGLTTASLQDNAVTTAKILNANVTPAKLSQPYTLATAQNSTSGTSIDFTGIPSWAKRITVMLNGVSTNGTSIPQIQIGAGSVATSGYLGGGQNYTTNGTSAATAASAGFPIQSADASNVVNGLFILTNVTANTWVISGTYRTNATAMGLTNGSLALGGTLDRVRITTVNGTDTFDAGTINIAYEG